VKQDLRRFEKRTAHAFQFAVNVGGWQKHIALEVLLQELLHRLFHRRRMRDGVLIDENFVDLRIVGEFPEDFAGAQRANVLAPFDALVVECLIPDFDSWRIGFPVVLLKSLDFWRRCLVFDDKCSATEWPFL
jgi:hypothetical protein